MPPDDTLRALRPCCGACRLTGLQALQPPWLGAVCLSCGVPWDGSVVDRDALPQAMEREIAAGGCTREQAFQAFLLMDDLAEAAAKGEITVEHGAELIERNALRVRGKARAE